MRLLACCFLFLSCSVFGLIAENTDSQPPTMHFHYIKLVGYSELVDPQIKIAGQDPDFYNPATGFWEHTIAANNASQTVRIEDRLTSRFMEIINSDGLLFTPYFAHILPSSTTIHDMSPYVNGPGTETANWYVFGHNQGVEVYGEFMDTSKSEMTVTASGNTIQNDPIIYTVNRTGSSANGVAYFTILPNTAPVITLELVYLDPTELTWDIKILFIDAELTPIWKTDIITFNGNIQFPNNTFDGARFIVSHADIFQPLEHAYVTVVITDIYGAVSNPKEIHLDFISTPPAPGP